MVTVVQLCSLKNTWVEGTVMILANKHIPAERLVGVMLMNTVLTQQEDDHMARCGACHELMVQETVRALAGPNTTAEDPASVER
jgi:hypothetical protein